MAITLLKIAGGLTRAAGYAQGAHNAVQVGKRTVQNAKSQARDIKKNPVAFIKKSVVKKPVKKSAPKKTLPKKKALAPGPPAEVVAVIPAGTTLPQNAPPPEATRSFSDTLKEWAPTLLSFAGGVVAGRAVKKTMRRRKAPAVA